MRFSLWIRKEGEEGAGCRECFNKPVGPSDGEWDVHHPSNKLRGRTQRAVEEWGRELVNWFNLMLRPCEQRREFVKAEIETCITCGHRGVVFDNGNCNCYLQGTHSTEVKQPHVCKRWICRSETSPNSQAAEAAGGGDDE